jgi:hypothetical protein
MEDGDVSLKYSSDVSPKASECAACRSPAPAGAKWCGKRCRQAAYRLRRRRATTTREDRPMRIAYFDPPYPGLSRKYYGNEASYAGEVDHAALVAEVLRDGWDGWALSTSARSLGDVLALFPPGLPYRVCAWTKPIGVSSRTFGIHNAWEPLIVVPARRLPGGVRDHLSAKPARGGGTLMGRKPIAFCAWLFDLLGALPGDTFHDAFPGSGAVGNAWRSFVAGGTPQAAPGDGRGPSLEYSGDVSLAAAGDVADPLAS